MNNAIRENIAVVGLGYVGCVTAACLADLGHHVFGIESDKRKAISVNQGRSPFYEPGLAELVRRNVLEGRLRATTSMAEGLAEAEIVLVCVGTPSERNGGVALEQLWRVSTEIKEHIQRRSKPLIVAVRSTVFPGTCAEIAASANGSPCKFSVVAHPEFLREGSAIKDFFEPSLLVVGGEDSVAVSRVAALYEGLDAEPRLMSLRAAEFVKYVCNAFHAMKVAFANEIATFADTLSIDANEVMETFCQDTKLNLSRAYLRPGFAFGGSCLPKDLRALVHGAAQHHLELPLLQSVLGSNDRHLDRAIQAVLDLPTERIGLYGLAFKENTDDLRESPIVTLVERLLGKGRQVRIFDPHIRLDNIYGSNRNFILRVIPHIGKLMEHRLETLLDWADYLVLACSPTPGCRLAIRRRSLPQLNLYRGQTVPPPAAGDGLKEANSLPNWY